jgi:primosomal replication protein N
LNRLLISGVVVETKPLRFSPAGVPIGEALIEHRATADLASGTRELACELSVQASGELAARLAGFAAGTRVRVDGALTRRSLNSRQLILIVNRIEKE